MNIFSKKGLTEFLQLKTDFEFEESIEGLKKRKEYLQKLVESLKFNPFIFIIFIIIGGVFGISQLGAILSNSSEIPKLSIKMGIYYFMLGALFFAFIYFYIFGLLRNSAQNRLRSIKHKLILLEAEELQDKIEDNFFTKLIQINFKYLEQHYLQNQEQADINFRLASTASIIGLGMIIFGITMMFFNKTEPAYVTTAVGVISEFIAAIFFYLYNKTVFKMSQYYQKFVITQNINLALKISDDMKTENKAKVQEMIIDRLTTNINKHLSSTE